MVSEQSGGVVLGELNWDSTREAAEQVGAVILQQLPVAVTMAELAAENS